jgi:hypothetical protein
MNGILAELGYPQIALIIIHNTDSESAIIKLGELCNIGNNSMDIVTRINFIHECIVAGIIRLTYVNTDNNVLTKLFQVSSHASFS